MNQATVYLVDDNNAFRESTTWLLEDAGFIVHDYADAQALLTVLDADATLPGEASCIITDLRMPGMSGLDLMAELKQRRCSSPVIMITAHGDVPLAVEAMRRGAANFIEKPFAGSVVVDIIHLAMRQPAALRDLETAGDSLASLSPRETEVMNLVCAGKLNKTIADVLGISIKTVELHRANMMHKLGAKNVSELIHTVLGYR